jgi:hypothetical protein
VAALLPVALVLRRDSALTESPTADFGPGLILTVITADEVAIFSILQFAAMLVPTLLRQLLAPKAVMASRLLKLPADRK